MEKSSSINGTEYWFACNALDTIANLFDGAQHEHELSLVRELKRKVDVMFKERDQNKAENESEQIEEQLKEKIAESLGTSEPEPEEIILSLRYDSIKILGTGVFGSAWKARCKLDHKFYAIKCIQFPATESSTESDTVAQLETIKEEKERQLNKPIVEVRVLSALLHQNIVQYYGAIIETYANKQWLCIRMQLYERALENWLETQYEQFNSLMTSPTHIKCLALSNRRTRIIVDIVQGLEFIHDRNLVHRDLHTANIFLEQKSDGLHAVIGDFGLSGANAHVEELKNFNEQVETVAAGFTVSKAQSVIKQTIKNSKRMFRSLILQTKSLNEYNVAWDLQRFGEIFFQTRYLQPLEDLNQGDAALPNYLLDSDIEIMKALARDWKTISWRCKDILTRHDTSLAFTMKLNEIAHIGNYLTHWENSMLPVVEQMDAGRTLGISPEFKVLSAATSNGALYLLCVRDGPFYSIHKANLNEHNLNANMIFEEELNVALSGILICKGHLVFVRDRKELLFVDSFCLPQKKALSVPLFRGRMKVKYILAEWITKWIKENVINSFSEKWREAILVNGPESTIFVAYRGSGYVFGLDVSDLFIYEETFKKFVICESKLSKATAATDLKNCMSSSPPIIAHNFDSVLGISAMCYANSGRELIVASLISEEKTQIEAYSYSHKNGLDHTRTFGFFWPGIYDLHLLPCEHLLLSWRFFTYDCFTDTEFNRNLIILRPEIFACGPMNSCAECVPLGICKSFDIDPRCWIVSSDSPASVIDAPSDVVGSCVEKLNIERDRLNALCHSSVFYIDFTCSNMSEILARQPGKAAVIGAEVATGKAAVRASNSDQATQEVASATSAESSVASHSDEEECGYGFESDMEEIKFKSEMEEIGFEYRVQKLLVTHLKSDHMILK